MLARVEPLADANGPEIRLPQPLEQQLVLGQQAVVQPAAMQPGGHTLGKADTVYLPQVVAEAILAAHVVEQPALVGKAVAEMRHHQRQSILLRLDGGKVSAVSRLLETHELHQPRPFPVHPLPHAHKVQHRRVGKVGLHPPRRIHHPTDVAEKHHRRILLVGQPALGHAAVGKDRQLAPQRTPHATGLCGIGHHVVHVVGKQRPGRAFGQQRAGKGTPGIGIEHRCQQPVERVVEEVDSPLAPPPSAPGTGGRHSRFRLHGLQRSGPASSGPRPAWPPNEPRSSARARQ